jgi:hypothetical protein
MSDLRLELEMKTMWLNTARACVKSADTKFGNEHIFDMENFDESSRRIVLRPRPAGAHLTSLGR